MSDQEQTNSKEPSFGQVIFAVAASAFGVRRSKDSEKDFQTKSAKPFIIGGIIFTLVFMATVYTVVRLVLS